MLVVLKSLDEFGEHSNEERRMSSIHFSRLQYYKFVNMKKLFGLEELIAAVKLQKNSTLRDEWKVGRVIARPYVGAKKGD